MKKRIVIIDDLFADHPGYESELRQKINPKIELEIISGPKGTAESEFGPLGIISQKALERVTSGDQEGVHYIVDIGFEGGLGLREHPAIKPLIQRAIQGIERESPEDLEYGILSYSIPEWEIEKEIIARDDFQNYLEITKNKCELLRLFLRSGESQIEPFTGAKIDEESAPLIGILDVLVERHLRPEYKGRVISKNRPNIDYKAGVLFRAYLQEKGISFTSFTSGDGHGTEGIMMFRSLGIIDDDNALDIYFRSRKLFQERGLKMSPEYKLALEKSVDTYVELVQRIAEQGEK